MKIENVKIYDDVDDSVVGNILAEAECNYYGYHGKIRVLVYEEQMYIFSINKNVIVDYRVNKRNYSLEFKVAYTEEDYIELKRKNGYKESYIEHIMIAAAKVGYDCYKKKRKK